MKDRKKESSITSYEISYRNYCEYLMKLAFTSYKHGGNAKSLVDGDIAPDMRKYVAKQQLADLKRIKLVFDQVKIYTMEQLYNKLSYMKNALACNGVSKEDQTINLDTIELIEACINLYPKLRLQ